MNKIRVSMKRYNYKAELKGISGAEKYNKIYTRGAPKQI